MTELINYLAKEWKTLSDAPTTFATTLFLAFASAFFAARWRYERIIDSLKSSIDSSKSVEAMLKERITFKDEQLSGYRERLKLDPFDNTVHSKLSNSELKQKSLNLVTQIRDFLLEIEMNQDRNFLNIPSNDFELRTNEIRKRSSLMHSEYDRKFKTDAILLRDELLARLPNQGKNDAEAHIYEHPTNPIVIGMIADNLEKLAKSLQVG